MRNKDRIPIFLQKIEELWELCPDLRFIQLIHMVTKGEDWFHKEDLEVYNRLQELIDVIEDK